MIQLALYQPEIPQNTGTLMRLCACMNMPMHIIEPCGFILNDQKLKRSVMDYQQNVEVIRHSTFDNFMLQKQNRLILMDTKGSVPLYDFKFEKGDILMMGQESCGVPKSVHKQVDHVVHIPMPGQGRSLNVAVAAAMGISTAMNQLLHAN